ncbi:hypothetical protein [Flectobacillus roseus]|uniref:Uncharacterized protein n=1 Tax=Flectobacillus roseus TaxID=502259 RepID=A0ABT6YA73_9BACT|nr:hypothetical protein [Flectobacillus roseus]MDI9860445.1 hypothetical protein [Flectobacillus roseus]
MKKVLLGIGLLISFFVIRHFTLQRVWDFDIYEMDGGIAYSSVNTPFRASSHKITIEGYLENDALLSVIYYNEHSSWYEIKENWGKSYIQHPFIVLKKGKIRKEIITDILSAPVDLYNIILIPQEALKAPYKNSQIGKLHIRVELYQYRSPLFL